MKAKKKPAGVSTDGQDAAPVAGLELQRDNYQCNHNMTPIQQFCLTFRVVARLPQELLEWASRIVAAAGEI